MDSFNPTPEWVTQGMDATWEILEVWGFPILLGVCAFMYLAPKAHQSAKAVKAVEYETASPIDDNVRLAREKMQEKLTEDSAVADKLRKEEEEEKRKLNLERLKNGPVSKKSALGRDYNPLMGQGGGMGGKGGGIGRVKPCTGGG